MVRTEFRNPLANLVRKVRKANYKLTCQKTVVEEKIDLGDGREMVLSCDCYSNLQKKISALDNCNIKIKNKNTVMAHQSSTHKVEIEEPIRAQKDEE